MTKTTKIFPGRAPKVTNKPKVGLVVIAPGRPGFTETRYDCCGRVWTDRGLTDDGPPTCPKCGSVGV